MNDARGHTGNRIRPATFYMVRVPILPVTAWLPLLGDQTNNGRENELVEQAQREEEHLKVEVQRPIVAEALHVASPEFAETAAAWATAASTRATDKVGTAVAKYVARMASRPTPFGLFAGVARGSWGSQARLEVADPVDWRRHARVDMMCLLDIARRISRMPDVVQGATFRPNTTIYRIAGQIRFLETIVDERAGVRTRLTGVEADRFVEKVLSVAAGGIGVRELIVELEGMGADPDDATAYVADLIESQVLVCDIVPSLTGESPLSQLIENLTSVADASNTTERLLWIHNRLEELNGRPLGIDPREYEPVRAALIDLSPTTSKKHTLQVDMWTAGRFELPTRVATDLATALERLGSVGFLMEPSRLLADFTKRFQDRYDAAEVSLTEALDEECGIGYFPRSPAVTEPGALVRGLQIPELEPVSKGPGGSAPAWLVRALEDVWNTGSDELLIDPGTLPPGKEWNPPDSFSVLVNIAASATDIDAGAYRIVLLGAVGPSAGNMMGRFCHMSSELREDVRALFAEEQHLHPHELLAEVVHIGVDRVGNVTGRPVLRSAEIEFGARSGMSRKDVIPVEDLTLCVRHGKLVLRSRARKAVVVPRLATAHRYYDPSNHSLYGFLCTLQLQETGAMRTWDWGPLGAARFLPRVRFGNVVVSKAAWVLDGDERRALLAEHTDGHRRRALERWRAARHVPRFVSVGESDHILGIDLESPTGVRVLFSILREQGRRGNSTRILELIPDPNGACVRGPYGVHTSEFLIPFLRTQRETAGPESPLRCASASAVFTRYPPGSEWLFLKVYTGSGTVDRVLVDHLYDRVHGFREAGLVEEWFFVRYADPEWHIRLRVRLSSEERATEVLPGLLAVTNDLIRRGLVERIELSTYIPELERYGGVAGLAICHHLFELDSEFVLGILRSGILSVDAELRWRAAMMGVMATLQDCDLDLVEAHRWLRSLKDGLMNRINGGKPLRRHLARQYRELRSTVEKCASYPDVSDDHSRSLAKLLAARSKASAGAIGRLREAASEGSTTASFPSIVSSLVHMQLNRLLRFAHREQEFVIYDFLERAIGAELARARRAGRG